MQLSVGQDGRLNRQITSLTKTILNQLKPISDVFNWLLGWFNIIINQIVFSFHLKTKKVLLHFGFSVVWNILIFASQIK